MLLLLLLLLLFLLLLLLLFLLLLLLLLSLIISICYGAKERYRGLGRCGRLLLRLPVGALPRIRPRGYPWPFYIILPVIGARGSCIGLCAALAKGLLFMWRLAIEAKAEGVA